MADQKITQLTAYTTPITTDVLPIVDITAGTTKKITVLNLLQVFNVKMYGATGDGTTDDYTAIAAAITAASVNGGTVFFPTGTYVVGTTPVISSNNVNVLGNGKSSIIKAKASTSVNCLKISGASNVTVREIEINGNKANTNQPATQYLLLNGIYITGSNNVIVENCVVHDCWAGGILADFSTNVVVNSNRVYNNRDNGIFFRPFDTTDGGVVGGVITNNIASGHSFSGIQAIRSQYITIANNVSYSNGPTESQGDGVGVEGCSYCTISSNVVYSNAIQGISVRPTDEGGTTIGSDHITVCNNVSYNHTSTNGDAGGIVVTSSNEIFLSGNISSGNYYGINICESHSLTCGDITFSDNRVTDNTNIGIRFIITSTPEVVLNDNYVADNASHGLYTDARVQVQGGVYKGATGSGHCGIYLDTGASGSFISGASIYDNADNGVLTNTSVANVEIKNCYFDNINTSAQGRALYEVTGPTRLIGNRIVNQSNEPYHFTSGSSVYIDEVGASVALNNLSSVAINTSLISDTDSTDDLGSSSKYWANGYLDKIYLNSTATLDGTTAGKVNVVGIVEADGYNSSDGSAGISTTVTTSSLVGKTITIKDGLITEFA